MKRTIMVSVASIGLLASQGALAQSGPAAEKSADQIVCELTGNCGGGAVDKSVTLDKPTERSFSIGPVAAAPTRRPPTSVRAPVAPQQHAVANTRIATSNGHMRNPIVAAPAPAPVRAVASGTSDMRITFATGSFEMTPGARANAAMFAKVLLTRVTDGTVTVEGHTDSQGTRDDNLKLSQERADSVAAFLVAQGVPQSRITAKGYGFDRPLGRSTAAPANRRVQLVLNR